MDQVKIGKFIAELRRKNGLTQEALGEKIGVTNKTISRWENGNYMPDIETLQLLAQEFHISIDELLSGVRMQDENLSQKADENVIDESESKAREFSMEERKAYFKKKWRKEHIWLLVALFLIDTAFVVLIAVLDKIFLMGFALLITFVEYCCQNNKMIYVEKSSTVDG